MNTLYMYIYALCRLYLPRVDSLGVVLRRLDEPGLHARYGR